MKPHRRQYEVHGQSVNLEKFRIHILEIINDNELTIPQIANALKTETRKLQGVLYKCGERVPAPRTDWLHARHS